MIVNELALRRMLVSGGFGLALRPTYEDSFSMKKLKTSVMTLPSKMDDFAELEGEEKTLFKTILEALDAGEEITIEEMTEEEKEEAFSPENAKEEDTEENEVEEEAPKRGRPKGKVNKPKEESEEKKEKSFPKKAGVDGKPGIIATIRETLVEAHNTKTPVTKEEVLGKLVKRFPDREPEAMKKTVNAQLGYHLKAHGYDVRKERVDRKGKELDGFFMVVKGGEDTSAKPVKKKAKKEDSDD